MSTLNYLKFKLVCESRLVQAIKHMRFILLNDFSTELKKNENSSIKKSFAKVYSLNEFHAPASVSTEKESWIFNAVLLSNEQHKG